MVPAELRVRVIVAVAVPRAFASALVMGFGLSFAADSAAVNTTVFGWLLLGPDGLLPQAVATSTAPAIIAYRFIVISLNISCVPIRVDFMVVYRSLSISTSVRLVRASHTV
jgi:hypothetical protein